MPGSRTSAHTRIPMPPASQDGGKSAHPDAPQQTVPIGDRSDNPSRTCGNSFDWRLGSVQQKSMRAPRSEFIAQVSTFSRQGGGRNRVTVVGTAGEIPEGSLCETRGYECDWGHGRE